MINISKMIFDFKRSVSDRRLISKFELKRKEDTLFSKFDSTKSLFIHIPKTGGTAIIDNLFESSNAGHHSALFYKSIYKEKFDEYFKFAFVRNPYDRLYSAFSYLKQGGGSSADASYSRKNGFDEMTFKEFVLTWFNEKSIYTGLHFVPQSFYVTDGSGKNLCDFIGTFENLSDDYIVVKNRLEIGNFLEKRNTSNRKLNYLDVYNQEMLDKVYDTYYNDFELLGYKKIYL